MPQPRNGEVRSAGGETRMWNGSGWQLVDSPAGPPSLTGLVQQPPPSGPSGRTDQQDFNAFKNLLTGAGSTLLPLLMPEAGIPMRLALAAAGGAAGRAAGHAMEPHPDASIGDDVALGGIEGAGMEAAPAIASGALKYGGRGLRLLGEKLNIGSPWMRGFASREAGMPAPVVAASVIGPPLAERAGGMAERAGERIGPETTSQRLGRFFKGADATPGPRQPVSREVPGFTMPREGMSVADMGNVVDRPALSAPNPVTDLGPSPVEDIPTPFEAHQIGRARSAAQLPASVPSSLRSLDRAASGGQSALPFDGAAAAENVTRNAPYGEGAVMPTTALPTELRDETMGGIDAPGWGRYDATLGMTLPNVPEFTHEAGLADVPGLTVESPSLRALSRASSVESAAPASSIDDVLSQYGDLLSRHGAPAPTSAMQPDVVSALQSLGYRPSDARAMAARSIASGAKDVTDAVTRALQAAPAPAH